MRGTESGQVTVWSAETHSKVTGFEAHEYCPVEVVDVSPENKDNR